MLLTFANIDQGRPERRHLVKILQDPVNPPKAGALPGLLT